MWSVALLTTLTLTVVILLTNTSSPLASGDDILIFNPPGCWIPCVLGITPGETDIDEAQLMIRQNVPIDQRNPDGSFWVENGSGKSLTIDVMRTDPRQGDYVSMIKLYSSGDEPITSLGAILERFGPPDRIFRGKTAGPDRIHLLATFGDGTVLTVLSGNDKIDQSTPIVLMVLIAPFADEIERRLNDIQLVHHYDDEIYWLGYEGVEDYWAVDLK